MPVSVVCETSANVNAALRESLGGGYSTSAVTAEDSKIAAGSSSMTSGNSDAGVDCLQSKLVASAKRVLLSKIEYEEVSNYSQSVLESLKTKYIVLKPSNNNNGNVENGRASPATGSGNNNGNTSGGSNNSNGANGSNTTDTTSSATANNNGTSAKRNGNNNNNTNNNNIELPQPKFVLYPRENVRIGWKNSTRNWQVGVGMTNVGNTCYLNSTLQALFHVPSVANWLMSDTQHMERCEAADAGCIICAMAKTLQASQKSQMAIRPYFVYSKLRSICKHLVMGRQEDAHEFLRYLVEAMEKSYLSRFRNYKELDQYSKETTPLNQILGGYLRSAVRCLSCNHVSVTFQHFEDLLLDIRKADTIEEALDGYFARERLEDMGYKCESCKKKVSATKQFSLERAPITLCIQLKRFSMLGTKLNKQITIKPRLDLTKYSAAVGSSRKNSNEQLSYKLVAMVTHLGASQHCGHYTAIGLTESGTYYNYDDSYVRPISVQNVCNTNAYIIFYEMDNTPPRHTATSTLTSNAAESKENYQQKTNGYVGTSATTMGNGANMQRMIGPQLPPTGLNSYRQTGATNGGSIASTYSNGGSKLSINRQSAIPTSSSKIMIHFKNNNTTIKSNAAAASSSSSTTSTVTLSSSQNGHGCTNSSQATPTPQPQNGLHAGTGKFQEPSHARSSLVSTSNKGQTAAVANGNESSSCSSCSDNEDEVSSSTQTCSKATLPSMPKLFDTTITTTNGNAAAATTSSGSMKKALTSTPIIATTTTTTKQNNLKSLVPYESESDDEDSTSAMEIKRSKCTSSDQQQQQGHVKNSLKRRQTPSNSSDNNTDVDDDDRTPSFGSKLKKTTCNSNTIKTDVIDEIFNVSKRHLNNTNNNNTNQHNTSNTISPAKKEKKSQQQLKLSLNSVRSTTGHNNDDDDDCDDDNNDDDDHEMIKKGKKNTTRPPFKRAHSTPPSPPVIKTKTGLWQVTTLKTATATTCASAPEQKSTTTKNPKNPFACKTPELFQKRAKPDKRNQTFVGNGYQRDTASDSAVSELLKQSHRGYGTSVLTWKGDRAEIEKEIVEEAREQRQRDWEEEEENEMDRGRQKKVKTYRESNHIPGYNPFQEQHEAQRRWKHGGSNGAHRFHTGHFRNQFQRNKFKFQRFNNKFQRSHSRNNNNNNNHANRRNNGGGNNDNGGGYNRRDS